MQRLDRIVGLSRDTITVIVILVELARARRTRSTQRRRLERGLEATHAHERAYFQAP
jgi:hypothetical protein